MLDAEQFSVPWLGLALCMLVALAVLSMSIAPLAQGQGPYSAVNGPLMDRSAEKALSMMQIFWWAASIVITVIVLPTLFAQFASATYELVEIRPGSSDLLALMCTRSC